MSKVFDRWQGEIAPQLPIKLELRSKKTYYKGRQPTPEEIEAERIESEDRRVSLALDELKKKEL